MRAHAHPETPVRSHLLALLGGFAGLHPAEDFLDSARCVVENFLRLVLLAVLGRDEFFLLGNAPSLSVPLQDIVRAKGQNHEQEQRVVAVLHLSEVLALFFQLLLLRLVYFSQRVDLGLHRGIDSCVASDTCEAMLLIGIGIGESDLLQVLGIGISELHTTIVHVLHNGESDLLCGRTL